MSGLHHVRLVIVLVFVHCASSLKLLTLVQPYLVQAPSTLLEKKEDAQELPIYRDLPPIKQTTKDLSEALEATRNLKFTRPPLDVEAFFASLKKAAEEVHSVVVGVAPPIADIQISKSTVMDLAEKSVAEKDEPVAKSSNEAFSANPKPAFTSQQVKRSDGSYVKYVGQEDVPLLKADSRLNVRVQAPFTDVQVSKMALEEGGTEVQIPNTENPVPNPQGGVGVGVHVDVPHTNVQVQKGGGYGYGYGSGGDFGVRVEAPFTSVKVKKLAADIPADALGPVGVPDVGVRVEAPFVKVKVDGPAVHKTPDNIPQTPQDGEGGIHYLLPKRSGRPLNLDINIPGIFNLKLLRDETGRGRLGIGVLPIFSSFVNQHKSSDSYPGPPPS